jgi:hypothetical protein
MSNEKSKLLDLIPKNLHPQLFQEVLEAIEAKKNEEERKTASKEEIAAIMEMI